MTKLRSDITKHGISRTPHRALMRATGLDDEAIAKPIIGVVSMKGEQTRCNMTHGFQVEAATQGVAEAGGTPREFSTISMSDGIGMNHEGMKFSLVTREPIRSRRWCMALPMTASSGSAPAPPLPPLPSPAGEFTANTMAMVSEALGFSVPNVSMIPGVYVERANHARRAGAIVMEAVLRGGPRPRDMVTRAALENPCAVVAATGGRPTPHPYPGDRT